jgi:hypothetical protein
MSRFVWDREGKGRVEMSGGKGGHGSVSCWDGSVVQLMEFCDFVSLHSVRLFSDVFGRLLSNEYEMRRRPKESN